MSINNEQTAVQWSIQRIDTLQAVEPNLLGENARLAALRDVALAVSTLVFVNARSEREMRRYERPLPWRPDFSLTALVMPYTDGAVNMSLHVKSPYPSGQPHEICCQDITIPSQKTFETKEIEFYAPLAQIDKFVAAQNLTATMLCTMGYWQSPPKMQY